MAQISLPRAAHRSAVEAEVVAEGGLQRPHDGPRARRNWALLYVGLVLSAIIASALVGVCAVVSELEAVRWKLSVAVAAERAEAMHWVREINANLTPLQAARIMKQYGLTTKPAVVEHVKLSRPLPPLEPTPVLTPQPLAIARHRHRELAQPSVAGFR